jgi:antitoxin MazE
MGLRPDFWGAAPKLPAILTIKPSCNYNVAMRTRIVKIGNSQGIRIPKLLLERSNLAVEVELEAEDHQITIRSTKQPRQDWESEFRAMAERGDDALADNNLLTQTSWDEDEWQW